MLCLPVVGTTYQRSVHISPASHAPNPESCACQRVLPSWHDLYPILSFASWCCKSNLAGLYSFSLFGMLSSVAAWSSFDLPTHQWKKQPSKVVSKFPHQALLSAFGLACVSRYSQFEMACSQSWCSPAGAWISLACLQSFSSLQGVQQPPLTWSLLTPALMQTDSCCGSTGPGLHLVLALTHASMHCGLTLPSPHLDLTQTCWRVLQPAWSSLLQLMLLPSPAGTVA